MRFQFQFGTLPESHISGKNMSGNLSMSYLVPYSRSDFSVSCLRSCVEHEHVENMKHAHRAKNMLRKQEREGIAKMSIDSLREWFSVLDVTEFEAAVVLAWESNTTTVMEGRECRLLITPQQKDAVIS